MNVKHLKRISYRIIGSFYGKGIIFLATAYVSRQVGPERYGELAIVLSLFSMFLVLGGTDLARAVATWSAQEPQRRRTHYWHGLGFICAAYLATMGAFYLFMQVAHPIHDPATIRIAHLYMPMLILFLLMELFKGVNLGTGRVGLLTIQEATQGTLKAALVVVFVYAMGFDGWLLGRVSGEALAFIVLLAMMIPIFRKDFKGQPVQFEKALLKRYAGYYGWSFLAGGLVQIQMQVQPFIVLYLVKDSSEVAFIKIALLYLSSIGLFGPSVTTALYADVAKKHTDREGLLRHLRKVLLASTLALAAALAALWVLAPWLINLLHGPAYAPVTPLFRVMLAASLFQHISFINGGYWLAVGNIRLLSTVSLISFFVFFALAIPLCWHWGTMGMALAVLASTMFNAAMNSFASHRWIVSHIPATEERA